MRIIAFIILLVLIIFLVYFIFKENSTKKNKVISFLSLIFILLFGYFYQTFDNKKQNNDILLVNHFSQGHDLICHDINISKKRFHYDAPTQSFLAKKGFEEIKNMIFKLSDCKIKDKNL